MQLDPDVIVNVQDARFTSVVGQNAWEVSQKWHVYYNADPSSHR